MKKIIILIPAYNEAKSISKTITSINREVNKSKIKSIKILVINDGSSDETVNKVVRLKNVLVYSHKVNQGLGAAVRTGLLICKKLKADFVVKIDADGQHDPKDVPLLLEHLFNKSADIVYGNRSLNFKTTIVRKLGNIFFSYLMRILTGWEIKDSQPGIFAINKDCLSRIKIFGNYNYTQQVLLSSQLAGMRFSHQEVTFSKREAGQSFVDLRYVYKALSQILVLLIFFQPLKIFGRFGLLLLSFGMLIVVYQSMAWMFGFSNRVVENVNLVLGLSIIGGQSLLAGLLGQLFVNLNSKESLEEISFEKLH